MEWLLLIALTLVMVSLHRRTRKLLSRRSPLDKPTATAQMAEPNGHPFDTSNCQDQNESPLFSLIPPEIRNSIFALALSDFEDMSNAYSASTYWARPGHYGPRRSSTALLRTCKRAYMEAWHLPFMHSVHSFYLGFDDRAPNIQELSRDKFQNYLDLIYIYHRKVEGSRLRVFAQLWSLEPGESFQELLDMRHFHPEQITLTIRYTDFWSWETNDRLYVGSKWVNVIRFPNTITAFTVEFEMIERRKDEVDYIANEAANTWVFQRMDGVLLTPCKDETSVSNWTGSSELGGKRWVRDEARPNELDYHVVSVTWRPSNKTIADFPLPVFNHLEVPENFPRSVPHGVSWIPATTKRGRRRRLWNR